MSRKMLLVACAAGVAMALAGSSQAAETNSAAAAPWMNPHLSADRRADLVQRKMTLDEQIALLHGSMPGFMRSRPSDVQISAGYIPGLPRLDIPALRESDASLGVANAGRKNDDATPLPSGVALASTWDPDLAFAAGAMIGKETRQKGFNVLLAGGVNLLRDPRNGRNFEYLSEDPLLSGVMDGAAIRGIQSQHVVSTAKHYVLNDQETGRNTLSANIDEAAFRESDLLAFEIAIETGKPGSVMCSYNRIAGVYACENPQLLTGVLKDDWKFPGWTMSDWGAVHSVASVNAGLDQESGQELDHQVFYDAPLRDAIKSGAVSEARIHDMTHRILRGMFAEGLFDHPVKPGGLDTAADGAVAARAAEQGVVLLKNQGGLLPLSAHAGRIAVIGLHADQGVLSGGGSSQVIPLGSLRFTPPKAAPSWGGGIIFHPYPPLKAIQARAGGAEVVYNDGSDPAAAAALAKTADVTIVFAGQWESEGMDVSMTLPNDQNQLIEAVAAANPKTIVVLETGGPVLTPWLSKVGAVVEAWYPGARGGETIGKILYGEVDPAGRLPVSFPAGDNQLPRPNLPGADAAQPESLTPSNDRKSFDVDYKEGSDVGYRWFAKTGAKPAFPFGYGLTYTQFRYDGLKVTGGKTLTVSFRVTNTGPRAGIDTPQVYLTAEPGRAQQRLIGWSRAKLAPGESRRVTVTADRRLLADWDVKAHGWRLRGGQYQLFVGPDAETASLQGSGVVAAGVLAP